MDITTIITSFEEALKYNGKTLEQFQEATKNDTPDEVGYKKVKEIVLALNEGENVDEGYYPWFWSARSARGFSFDDYLCERSVSGVGSRHLLKYPILAIYAGTTFEAEYSEWING